MTLDAYAAFPTILCDRPAPGVLRLTLNRPEKMNALDADGHRELADIWRVVDRDRETLAVLLCAKGKAFSAGGDFDVVTKLTQSFEERANMWREARDLVYNIINCSKPIVSAIHGPVARSRSISCANIVAASSVDSRCPSAWKSLMRFHGTAPARS